MFPTFSCLALFDFLEFDQTARMYRNVFALIFWTGFPTQEAVLDCRGAGNDQKWPWTTAMLGEGGGGGGGGSV